MVLRFEEEKELLLLKQEHQANVLKTQDTMAENEHKRRMARLDKLLEIALAGGIGYIEK